MEPVNTRSAADAASAYMGILHWPIAVGHRFRPRQGCTCERADCPTPGAHPVFGGPLSFQDPDEFLRRLEAAPGAALITPTTGFDAIVVPHRVGMSAIVELERRAPLPCLSDGRHAVLLVRPSTGRDAVSGCRPAEVRSGPDQWIALPPSHGLRWDTHPWIEQTTTPLPLVHGDDVARHLRMACRSEEGVR